MNTIEEQWNEIKASEKIAHREFSDVQFDMAIKFVEKNIDKIPKIGLLLEMCNRVCKGKQKLFRDARSGYNDVIECFEVTEESENLRIFIEKNFEINNKIKGNEK